MIIVENKEQLETIYEELKVSDSFFVLIPENPFNTSPFNDVSLLFIYLFQYEKTYCLVNTHPDFEFDINLNVFFKKIDTNKSIFVYNKKLFLSFIDNKREELKSNFIDIDFVSYICENKALNLEDITHVTNVYKKFLKQFKNKAINGVIPITSHYEYYEKILHDVYQMYNKYKHFIFSSKEQLLVLDEYFTNNFYDFERNGIFVDYHKLRKHNPNIFIKNNLIYGDYKFYTKTGRPTNAYAKLNLLALNKKTGIRKIFTSRFKDEGLLYQFDYSSFHLKLISILTDELHGVDNMHIHLGNIIYPKLDLTDESNYEKVKGLIFKQLYGGVSKEFMHIAFFKKLSKFVDTLWDEFNTKGFITSKLFKRVIYKKWFDSSINKLTLFNYYIQSFESELCAFIIKDINDYIKNNELQSELILYTYDSFLLDVDKSEISTHLQKIKDIITYNNILTVTTKFGDNYQDLNSIKI